MTEHTNVDAPDTVYARVRFLNDGGTVSGSVYTYKTSLAAGIQSGDIVIKPSALLVVIGVDSEDESGKATKWLTGVVMHQPPVLFVDSNGKYAGSNYA